MEGLGGHHGHGRRGDGQLSAREHGVTLLEVAIVALVAGLLVGAVAGARAAIRYAQKSQAPRMANAVGAAFQAFYEDLGRLPGDHDGDGSIEGAGGEAVAADDIPRDDAVLDMVQEGFLDGSQVEYVPPGKFGRVGTDDRILFPGRVKGIIRTTSTVWPGETVHSLEIDCGSDIDLTLRIDEVLDDGDPLNGQVRRTSSGGVPPQYTVHVALLRR